jgi:hypothetical protein
MYRKEVFIAAVRAVPGLPTHIHVIHPLLRDMFLLHKDHLQVSMLMHVNCFSMGTLTMRYSKNSLFLL